MLLGVLISVVFLGGCGSSAKKDLTLLADKMCECQDSACVQGVRDEASATRSLLDLADPMEFEQRFGTDAEMMAAMKRFDECAAKHD